MIFAGVDGCPKGWFIVSVDQNKNLNFSIFEHIDMLWKEYNDSALILIDIPIGLPHWRSRLCDVQARKILGKRGASVFPAPSREAIHQLNYESACKVNQKILGKKLSKQAWNISSKIKQVDMLLIDNKNARNIMRESHPEICLWALSGGTPMIHNKRTKPGFQERLEVLKKINPFAEDIFNESLKTFKRKELATDDILDAIALAFTACSPPESLFTVPENPEKDLKDLPMEIVYSNQYL